MAGPVERTGSVIDDMANGSDGSAADPGGAHGEAGAKAAATAAALGALQAHYQAMPPVAAMGLRIDGWDGEALRLQAPLALHVNDKGCAFGGSLASLMTLAGWGLVTLRLQASGLEADVYVADSSLRYRAPLFDALVAEARLEGERDWAGVLADFRERGRASLHVAARVALPGGGVAAESRARYVLIARRGDASGGGG